MGAITASLAIICMIAVTVQAAGRVEVKLMEYNNPSGRGSNGHCCDGRWGVCQHDGCDYVFDICLDAVDSDNSTRNCRYAEYQTDEIENQDSVQFSDRIGGVDNPIVFTFNKTTPSFSLKVKVSDYDDSWLNDNDDVDFLRYDNYRAEFQFFTTTLRSRTWMPVEFLVRCDHESYGPSCVYCPQAPEYTCTSTGQKLCNDGWEGDECDRRRTTTTTTTSPIDPTEFTDFDCDNLADNGYRYKDGVYMIRPTRRQHKLTYCMMDSDGDGWTLIQRNVNGDTTFDRAWNEYKNGFGDPAVEHNYWMGLQWMHNLTKARPNELHIVMKLGNGEFRQADYESVAIGDESSGYRIQLRGYSGSAGDAFDDVFPGVPAQNGQRFSTKDREHDDWSNGNCAERYTSGWWFSNCYINNLNGVYTDTGSDWPSCDDYKCIAWNTIPDYDAGLVSVEMYIKPVETK